ncbi:MAG TPA: serine hydrolase [Candidatus Binatia bacterium]|nr:serine hydrolase [Candidatus Binatia bacterium]
MRRTALFLALALFLAAAPASKRAPAPKPVPKPAPESKPAPGAKALEFPNNEAGRHAAAWFEAFNQGDEAMRKFLQAHVAPAALARRTLQDRMDIYRDMKDERGRVMPLSIESFTESSVKAIARGERGGRFAITFRCEDDAPHGLLGLQVEDLPPEEGAPEGNEDGGYSRAPAGPVMKDAQVATALRAYVDSLARADAFSGAILLAKGDRVLERSAYGLASRRYGTPNRFDTKFNLGSINKAFTKVAIEQLAARGKLSLDDTIDKYVPDYPRDEASKITIRMLLDHRSGVPDFFGPKFQNADRTQLRSVSDWVQFIRDMPLRFEPGTREEYSNGGYILLGAVIEKASGMDYYDYVRRNIYEPAGMKDTDSYQQDDPVRNLAEGYTKSSGRGTDGRWRDAALMHPWRGSPAGGGYSTVDDLYRFAQALRSGTLGARGEAGMAIAGGSPGTNAMLMMQGDWTLVVLSNLDPPAAERVGTRSGAWLRRAGVPMGGATHRISARPLGAERSAREEKPASTILPDGGAAVPMTWAGHLASVSVMLNGQGPFRFAIDTGAAGCARIDAAVARKLGLPVVGEARVGDPSGKNMKSAEIVSIDSLAIGGARFVGLTATAGDLAGHLPGEAVDGILGFGLFDDCLLTLDFPALRMTLAEGSLPADGAGVLTYRDERGIPSVTMRVAGVSVDTDVDAGAMGGFSLPESFAAKLPLAEPPRVVGHARTVSNEFEIKAARLDGDVAVGGTTFAKPMVEFQPVFDVGNIGARVLRDFAVTFDPKNHRMRLARSA